VGQLGLLQDNKEIYREKEMKGEREIVQGVCAYVRSKVACLTWATLLTNHTGLR